MTELQAAVAQAIGLLSVLPNGPTDASAVKFHSRAWHAVLESEQILPSAVLAGATDLLKSCRFFPPPVDLLEACRKHMPEPKRIEPKVDHESLALPWKNVPLSERADRDQIIAIRAKAEKLFALREMPPEEDTKKKRKLLERQFKEAQKP